MFTGFPIQGGRISLWAACLLVGLTATPEAVELDERQFSYRGRETLGIKMVGTVPQGASQRGVEVQVAGVMVQGNDLSYNFGVACESKPIGIVVEDVTAATAIRLVEQFPVEGAELGEDGRWLWFGRGGEVAMDPRTVPWVLKDGETSFVFRIFVEMEDGSRAEIYQPAVFGEDFKMEIRGRLDGIQRTSEAEPEGGAGKNP